jgi:hypothetical protein
MFRRILAMKLKIILVLAVVGGVVVIARKLMGGLGPEPGSELAPKEWPSLVPDPPAASGTDTTDARRRRTAHPAQGRRGRRVAGPADPRPTTDRGRAFSPGRWRGPR